MRLFPLSKIAYFSRNLYYWVVWGQIVQTTIIYQYKDI
ncbi:hypothetical protein T4A_12609 [Trichinella pseudospiralis]|uniref:Uncharacterized protein n=1 Tax=Trichinella pseudospiralis TaxID=6337 RepID=A0A0V1E0J9_TRIPS|nr:hypothetical protein T4A_12609 [Trichinella pseudospiralis]KRZ19019.1 hypothetical protein T4C_8553 [Trichinella pseudospiralis]KRZ20550.1 hypothetical protein T4C_11333 [Trichinella pseudospiralis]